MLRRTTNMWEIHTKLSKSLHAKEGLGTLRTQDVRGYTSILFGKKMTKTVPLNSLTCHQCQDDQHIWHGCFKRHEHIEKNNTFKGVLGTQYVIVVFIPFLYSSIEFLAICHVFLWKGSLWCRGERKAILSHIESIRPVHSIYEGVWNERKKQHFRSNISNKAFWAHW